MAKLKARVDNKVLEAAEKLVADVKAGKIKAFAVAYATEDAPYTGSFSGIPLGDILSAKLLESACHELTHVWLHAVNR
jgi:hypothetical protein